MHENTACEDGRCQRAASVLNQVFWRCQAGLSGNWQQKHYDSSFNVSVSFHDQGGVELPQAAVRMFVSFEEFSVLF